MKTLSAFILVLLMASCSSPLTVEKSTEIRDTTICVTIPVEEAIDEQVTNWVDDENFGVYMEDGTQVSYTELPRTEGKRIGKVKVVRPKDTLRTSVTVPVQISSNTEVTKEEPFGDKMQWVVIGGLALLFVGAFLYILIKGKGGIFG